MGRVYGIHWQLAALLAVACMWAMAACQADSVQSSLSVRHSLGLEDGACVPKEVGGPPQCMPAFFWEDEAQAACEKDGFVLGVFELGASCYTNRFDGANFTCCPDETPVCQRHVVGSVKACRPPWGWEQYADKKCIAMGQTLADFNAVYSCGDGGYHFARYICCDADPPDGPCDDDTALSCDGETPECGAGSIMAIQDGCYVCVDPVSCGVPCDDAFSWDPLLNACCPDAPEVEPCDCSEGFFPASVSMVDGAGCWIKDECLCQPETCGDGEVLDCDLPKPVCGSQQLVALQEGCWLCAWADTCEPVVCEVAGQAYNPQETFPAGDGCNDCQCQNDGQILCADAPCPVICDYGGTLYEVGASFSAGDGCNTCECAEDGEVVCEEESCACDPDTEWYANYVSTNASVCGFVPPSCPASTEAFTNDCGCGCIQSAECLPVYDCAPASGCNVLEILTQCPYSEITWF